VKRLLAAWRAAPVGGQYGSTDVHFVYQDALAELTTDTSEIGRYIRQTYPLQSFTFDLIQVFDDFSLARLFATDGKVDADEWRYMFDLGRNEEWMYRFGYKLCRGCLRTLLEVRDHGSPQLRDERFFQTLKLASSRSSQPRDRMAALVEILPRDPEFILHVAPLLTPDLRRALDWKYFLKLLNDVLDSDATPEAERVDLSKRVLSAMGTLMAGGEVNEAACTDLPDQIDEYIRRGGPFAPAAERTCACLTGPMSHQATRARAKAKLHDYALSRGLTCVRPR
jgi:hypothetical protein